MEREQELAIIRRAYAKQVLAEWQVDDPRLELAFTQVRREDFLGPGPWVIPDGLGSRVVALLSNTYPRLAPILSTSMSTTPCRS